MSTLMITPENNPVNTAPAVDDALGILPTKRELNTAGATLLAEVMVAREALSAAQVTYRYLGEEYQRWLMMSENQRAATARRCERCAAVFVPVVSPDCGEIHCPKCGDVTASPERPSVPEALRLARANDPGYARQVAAAIIPDDPEALAGQFTRPEAETAGVL